jgi:hypothetical protein
LSKHSINILYHQNPNLTIRNFCIAVGAPADAPAYMCVVLQMQLPYVLLTPLLDYQVRLRRGAEG